MEARFFFDDVNLHPSSRVEAESTGRRSDTSDIVIRVYTDVLAGPDAGCWPTIRGDRARAVTINLRPWCLASKFNTILMNLHRWHVSRSSSSIAVIPVSRALCSTRAPAMSDASEELQRALQCACNAGSVYGEWFPKLTMDNHGVSHAVVARLVSDGVLKQQLHPLFGDEELQLVYSQLQFIMSHALAEPDLVREHAREVADVADSSKT